MTALCDECRPKWLAWLDYRLPPAPIQLITIGGNSPREMQARQEARARQWRDTIRSQQQIIADNCARLHSAAPADAVGGDCAVYDGPHRDQPGRRCRTSAAKYREAGTYRVPVCTEHSAGPGLFRLGGLFYGFPRGAR